MEVLTADNCGNFHAITTPEHSPTNQSPMSTSPSPEHHTFSLNTSQEQSLHIIVEPQMDGQTNFIHLINPPTGQIISSYIAEHGSHIEIQPGVFFRVPFPHEHTYPFSTGYPMPQQQFHPHFQSNMVPPHSLNGVSNMPNTVIPSHQYNPSCAVHGSPGNNDKQYQQSGNERLDKRREKLQKKIKSKHTQSECTCFKHYNGSTNENGGYKGETPHAIQDDENADVDISIKGPLQVEAISPYAIIVDWENISKNNQFALCLFELQISKKGNVYKSIYCGRDSSFTAKDLNPGTSYIFRLCAKLNGRQGPFSDTKSCATKCTVPSMPPPPRIIQKTKNALTLKWAAPQSDGGSTVTQYKLQWWKEEVGGFDDLYVGLQKQFKHSHKLPPGTPCRFRLQATNELGCSEFSHILECLTSAGPPNAPDKVELVRCDINSISVKWSEPNCNGSPILDYKLERDDPNDGYGFMVRYCGEDRQFCCDNLQRNTLYKFRVMASNSYGPSKYSTPISYSTLPEAPGKMEKPKLNGKIKTHSIPVKWAAPQDTGGEEISGYILQVDDGKGGPFVEAYRGSDHEYVLNQLKPGHTYRIHVASESKAGVGDWSPMVSFSALPVSPRVVSSPRLSSQAKPEMTMLHLEWDSPHDNGGATITSYQIKMADSMNAEFQSVYNGPNQLCSIGDLQPGTVYCFKLQAANTAGVSPWSALSSLTTAPGPPDAILPPTVSFKTPTHIRMDWTEPSLHGSQVTSYSTEKLENEVFQKVYQGSCLFCEVKRSIQPASSYYFRLQAHSEVGSSPYSRVFTVETPSAPPGPVTDIKVIEQTSSSCLVEWQHPVENGSRIIEYVVEATGATSLMCTIPRPPPHVATPIKEMIEMNEPEEFSDDEEGSDDQGIVQGSLSGSETSSSITSRSSEDTMEYRLTGLIADASYRLRIQAVNEIGSGPFSHPVQFYTKELPPSPPTLTASSSSYHSIKLKWSDSSASKTISALNHTLQMQNKNGTFTSIYSGMGTSFTLSKLKDLAPYCFRVRSRNDAGDGEYSKSKVFYTKPKPPSQVKDFRCDESTMTTLSLSWTAVETIRNDDTMHYVLQMQQIDKMKDFVQIYKGVETKFTVADLHAESMYQFRVHAARLLSATSAPCSTGEVKGVNSSILRANTLAEDVEVESEVSITSVEEGEPERSLTDTHIALIILGSFLVVCAVVAVLMTWLLGEVVL